MVLINKFSLKRKNSPMSQLNIVGLNFVLWRYNTLKNLKKAQFLNVFNIPILIQEFQNIYLLKLKKSFGEKK